MMLYIHFTKKLKKKTRERSSTQFYLFASLEESHVSVDALNILTDLTD